MTKPLLLAALLLLPLGARAACPPRGETRSSLQALKVAGFEVKEPARREALALALVDCLGSPDPLLRDEVAFEALSTWMRGKLLSVPTVHALYVRLLPELSRTDAVGFRQPFSALVLSEVARVDRLQPFLTPEERERLVEAAAQSLSRVRDYRGFEERSGWRHGVAHGADLLLQLAMHPALTRSQADRMLEALAVQVAPAGGHAYVFGEPGRLARPVFAIASKGLYTPAEWTAWLSRVTALPGGMQALKTSAGLARRHDVLGFLQSLYVALQEGEDATARERLLPGVRAALRAG
ncbi:DUF2785 domain-containing protein [Aggregicoccus sp. 17bor-14]|uniref:DUF2785 domain-containing protein n=1 Tax=Myxococcaceae TaxID=31 RepID=UPI00129CF541|nr:MULTISPECIES: DUF2785 domain-containing protein [Myxococcaceae]MBF5045772.1 DUF2785 domain-containing protein [Simulacricoccus sp. 17bor-14]MRI91507.1 DUF2785 domain-containing protein [Aggregicoccus sp. 17bor-14]